MGRLLRGESGGEGIIASAARHRNPSADGPSRSGPDLGDPGDRHVSVDWSQASVILVTDRESELPQYLPHARPFDCPSRAAIHAGKGAPLMSSKTPENPAITVRELIRRLRKSNPDGLVFLDSETNSLLIMSRRPGMHQTYNEEDEFSAEDKKFLLRMRIV
jgi:hypothetical protein